MSESTTTAMGTVYTDGSRRGIRLQRTYPAAPETVWAALTEPERLRGWLGELTGTINPGAEFTLTLDDEGESIARCRVRRFEPPRLLIVDWTIPGEGDSLLRFELTPVGDGTELLVDHSALPVPAGPEYGAGWQTFLEQLGAHLAGRPGRDGTWDARYEQLLPTYQHQADSLRP